MKKMLFATLILLPLAALAEDIHSPDAIKKTTGEYLTTVNYIYGVSTILLRNVEVDASKRNVRFSYNRFTVFNQYATCEIVDGHMSYDFRKVLEDEKMLITGIEQRSRQCELSNPASHEAAN